MLIAAQSTINFPNLASTSSPSNSVNQNSSLILAYLTVIVGSWYTLNPRMSVNIYTWCSTHLGKGSAWQNICCDSPSTFPHRDNFWQSKRKHSLMDIRHPPALFYNLLAFRFRREAPQTIFLLEPSSPTWQMISFCLIDAVMSTSHRKMRMAVRSKKHWTSTRFISPDHINASPIAIVCAQLELNRHARLRHPHRRTARLYKESLFLLRTNALVPLSPGTQLAELGCSY